MGAADNADSAQSATHTIALIAEDQQRLEQWLQRIPDEPGVLLQPKFALEHRTDAEEPETRLGAMDGKQHPTGQLTEPVKRSRLFEDPQRCAQ